MKRNRIDVLHWNNRVDEEIRRFSSSFRRRSTSSNIRRTSLKLIWNAFTRLHSPFTVSHRVFRRTRRRIHQWTSSNVSTRFRSLSWQHLGYACVREQREEKQGNMKTSCCTVTSKTRGEEKQHRQRRNEREHVECVSGQRNEKDKSHTDERRRVNQRVRFDC